MLTLQLNATNGDRTLTVANGQKIICKKKNLVGLQTQQFPDNHKVLYLTVLWRLTGLIITIKSIVMLIVNFMKLKVLARRNLKKICY